MTMNPNEMTPYQTKIKFAYVQLFEYYIKLYREHAQYNAPATDITIKLPRLYFGRLSHKINLNLIKLDEAIRFISTSTWEDDTCVIYSVGQARVTIAWTGAGKIEVAFRNKKTGDRLTAFESAIMTAFTETFDLMPIYPPDFEILGDVDEAYHFFLCLPYLEQNRLLAHYEQEARFRQMHAKFAKVGGNF